MRTHRIIFTSGDGMTYLNTMASMASMVKPNARPREPDT